MKHGISVIIIAAIILLCVVPTYAAVYADDENDLTIDINYGDGVYYYTPEKNNLFNDLTQKINSDERDIRFYVTKYNPDNSQPYALLITSQPLNLTNTAGVDVLDITTFSDNDKAEIVQTALSEHTADFNFTDPVDSVLGGVSALLVKGVNKEDSEDILDIYINSNGSNYIITQAQYFNSTDTSQINSLVNSIKYSDDLIASAQTNDAADPASQSSPTPAPTIIAEITSVSENGEQTLDDDFGNSTSPEKGSFFERIWSSITNAYKSDPFFIWYIVGAALILAVIIILTVSAKKRRAKENGFESQFDVEEDLTVLEEISITPRGEGEDIKSEPRLLISDFTDDEQSAPRKIVHMMDETIMYNKHVDESEEQDEADFRNNRIEEQIETADEEEENDMSSVADFEKDISKYTRQPGMDVNDISKNTVNAYDDDDLYDEIERTRANDKTGSQTPSWKTQGTRMSRHKKKK